MSEPVADGAPQAQLVDDGPLAFLEIGDVVALEQLGAPAVDTRSVPFFDHSLLAGGRASLARRSIDWLAFRIVDQRPDERLVDQLRNR